MGARICYTCYSCVSDLDYGKLTFGEIQKGDITMDDKGTAKALVVIFIAWILFMCVLVIFSSNSNNREDTQIHKTLQVK